MGYGMEMVWHETNLKSGNKCRINRQICMLHIQCLYYTYTAVTGPYGLAYGQGAMS